jgi:putative Holliday junction resolvase
MRYLGIDYGSKRVGLALSDESGSMAFPHAVISPTDSLARDLAALCEREAVGAIVIGHSLDRYGDPNPVHTAVETLVTDLTLETGLPVHLEPEQYTTRAAERIQGRTPQTDAAAAALILDSYLTKQTDS